MKCSIDVTRMDLTRADDKLALQGVLDDIYQRFSQLEIPPKPTFGGSPSGRTYELTVDDSAITTPTVVPRLR